MPALSGSSIDRIESTHTETSQHQYLFLLTVVVNCCRFVPNLLKNILLIFSFTVLLAFSYFPLVIYSSFKTSRFCVFVSRDQDLLPSQMQLQFLRKLFSMSLQKHPFLPSGGRSCPRNPVLQASTITQFYSQLAIN